MPRKSIASLSVVPLKAGHRSPSPRSECSAAVKSLFREIVSKASKDHFCETDDTLLELYCVAVLEARLAHSHLQAEGRILNGRPSPWVAVLEKATKSVVSLSVRLRLGPHSRIGSGSSKLEGPAPSAYDLLRQQHAADED
jgi:phage terminase small subunit